MNLLEHPAVEPAARRHADALDAIAGLKLQPAIFAGYGDLSKLRYDYPLVLVRGDSGGMAVQSLSCIIDGILTEIAPRGMEGERLRKHVLRLEGEIRTLVMAGAKGSLSQLWQIAESNLLSRDDAAGQDALKDSLACAGAVLALDGEFIDCNEETPVELLTHLWGVVHARKARRFLDKVDRLVLGLSNILKVDFMKSDDTRTPERLKHSFGTAYEQSFDFETMSRLLGAASSGDLLPDKRRQRIHSALAVLESQRFFAPARSQAESVQPAEFHGFVFESCMDALDAIRDRLPEIAALVGAIGVAELELDNRYRESVHDPYFARLDENSLAPEDLALFPSYLVCLRDGSYDDAEQASLFEALSSGLPIKVLVQSDDILAELPVAGGKFSFGRKGSQLASMAIGLNSAFVLQSTSSHLYQMRERILRGFANDGTALFSVFSGCCAGAPDIPAYLQAAAAMESRAFPAFAYDPTAGPDLASRFCVDENPQADADWSVYQLDYEDEHHQRVAERLAFTFADFVAGDRRYAGRFARVPRSRWHEGMVPAAELLGSGCEVGTEKIPYVPMVGDDNLLQKLVVDDELMLAARRCSEMWHNLQELGGINSSHARSLLDKERALWQRQKEQESQALEARTAQEVKSPGPSQEARPQEEIPQVDLEEAIEAPADEPYIETPRCTTCDECTQINNRMFIYDENKQAYIADPDAGTYRELVEAAESCQVCVIHPGKPRNPNEPNLDELIKRAESFR